jgi:hypothetical protein
VKGKMHDNNNNNNVDKKTQEYRDRKDVNRKNKKKEIVVDVLLLGTLIHFLHMLRGI